MNDVREMCESVRRMFESILEASGIAQTDGTCLYASFLLHLSLTKFGGCAATICGGDGSGDGGALDIDGKLHGHYWIEGTTPDGIEFVADITGDQFGRDRVIVLSLDVGRSWYLPGDQEKVSHAVDDLRAECEEMNKHPELAKKDMGIV